MLAAFWLWNENQSGSRLLEKGSNESGAKNGGGPFDPAEESRLPTKSQRLNGKSQLDAVNLLELSEEEMGFFSIPSELCDVLAEAVGQLGSEYSNLVIETGRSS
ncbi:hypothetical protein [Roseibacillus persicicus]|uniref:Uncharacterized protein n=1 Tax=Roseibacillus persicicus TaxID=454148 RepID=A0A918TUU8_9BACT|nr:hypothetical protein GCM10007100_32830 [Roseibacillus persicicus]